MQEKIKIENGINYQCASGQHEHLVMPQTPLNKKALLNGQDFGFRQAAASCFSLRNLSRAISITCVRSLIAGEFFFTYASRAERIFSGRRIETGTRMSLDIFRFLLACRSFIFLSLCFCLLYFQIMLTGRAIFTICINFAVTILTQTCLLFHCNILSNYLVSINCESSSCENDSELCLTIPFSSLRENSVKGVSSRSNISLFFDVPSNSLPSASFKIEEINTCCALCCIFSNCLYVIKFFILQFLSYFNYIQRNTMYVQSQEKSLQNAKYFYMPAKQRKNKSFVRAAAPHFLWFDGITVALSGVSRKLNDNKWRI